MDDESQFWVAQQVADTKNTLDITSLFRKGDEVVRPDNTLISDGCQTFIQHSIRVMDKQIANNKTHINHITFDFTLSFAQLYKEKIS